MRPNGGFLQSRIVGQRDDFFNIHTTLLVVLECTAATRSCLVVNPHVESGKIDTTYSMNSLLEAARPGDRLSFVPMYAPGQQPGKLQRLVRRLSPRYSLHICIYLTSFCQFPLI